jgi:hypothetical protein
VYRWRTCSCYNGKWKQRFNESTGICSSVKIRNIYRFGLVSIKNGSKNELFEEFII